MVFSICAERTVVRADLARSMDEKTREGKLMPLIRNPRPLPSRATRPSAVLPSFMTGEVRWQQNERDGHGLRRTG